MELAATPVWTTHINLTPMYFNKAEGCYRNDCCVAAALLFFISYNKTTVRRFALLPLHTFCRQGETVYTTRTLLSQS